MTTEKDLDRLAQEAVIYTYPLYEMSRMRAATSPRRVEGSGEAPGDQRWCNVLVHGRKLLGAGKSRVVMPNNDTLYTNSWLDLNHGPLVFDVPDTQGRYYVLGLLDFYTNPFAHPGSRTTGTTARSFVVLPPGWAGELPSAFDAPEARIQAPTRWVWLIGRTLVDGPQDLGAVHEVQDGFRLRPLADWVADGPEQALAFDPACEPQAPLTPERYVGLVNAALMENPPPADEHAMVARFAAVGVGPGLGAPSAEQAARLQQALDTVLVLLRGSKRQPGASGWIDPPRVTDSFGQDYEGRARIALMGIGMVESREALYPMVWTDAQGATLNGAHRYRLHFAPGELPPVEAFWSITLYDAADFMLVPNAIDRFSIGDRTPGLRRDADGGLSLYFQREAPRDEAELVNWLPTSEGDFYLSLRAYIPKPEMLEGRYQLQGVERLDNEEAKS